MVLLLNPFSYRIIIVQPPPRRLFSIHIQKGLILIKIEYYNWLRCYNLSIQLSYLYMSERYFELSGSVKDKVFRFAARILDNYEDAQDVVQDVLERLWIKRESLHQYDNIEALSLKNARNLCMNRIKHQKQKRDKLITIANEQKELYNHTNQEEKELDVITKQLISKLPEKQKMVIQLRDVEGFEFKEISEILEMDINAIRMNLSRARHRIREQLIKIMNHGL